MSAGLTWTAYLATALGLLAILIQPVSQATIASRREAALTCLRGVAQIVDSLEPGLSVSFTYECVPAFPVSMSGHLLTISASNINESALTRWQMPGATLQQGQTYRLSLSAGTTVVVSHG